MSNPLKVTKHFNANVAAIFDAWTKPELLTKWMGPGNVTCVKFECDLCIGGQYEMHMQTDDEGLVIAYGEYKEIEINKKLSFTWSWQHNEVEDTLVTISFNETNSGTELILEHFNLPNQEMSERHEMGWNGCIEKLEQFLNT
jgi:uncharacterized protein YndB with AHSA1/START domain